MIDGDIYIECTDPEGLHAALSPEAGAKMPRTDVSITTEGNTLHIHITAKDLSALRAATNAYLRWVDMGLKLLEM